jgi:hypothetical protein
MMICYLHLDIYVLNVNLGLGSYDDYVQLITACSTQA